MEEFFSTSSILDPTTPISGLTPNHNPPDTTPSYGPLTPNAITKTALRQNTMENYITISSSLPLTKNQETTLTMWPDVSNDFTYETDSPKSVIYVHSPSSPEATSPLATVAKTIANSNGSLTKTTSIIPSDTSHRLQNNLIASAMDWPKRTSKMNLKPKEEFIQFLRDNMIINNRHYEVYLSNYPSLGKLETKLSVNSLEALKKTIFRQNYLIIQNSNMLENRVELKSISIMDCHLGLVNYFLKHIAEENQIGLDSLKHHLGLWLFNRNHKKRGLILCGPSDTGKSFFGNLLYGMYQPHEIGYFNCPTGPQPSSFMLQQLTNCLAYRCDEMIFENLGVLQTMKQLLEGSSTLHTDVKYKEPIKVDPRSVLITMNATYKNEIFKWHPCERQPFENRCLILFMSQKLSSIMSKPEIEFLTQCSNVLYYMLFKSVDYNKKTGVNLDKYIMYSQLYILTFFWGGSSSSLAFAFVKYIIG